MGATHLRLFQRSTDPSGTLGSRSFAPALYSALFHRSSERRKFTSSQRSGRSMGHLRGEVFVGRNYLQRHFTRHRHIHPYIWTDHEQTWLGGCVLHPRRVAIRLVRRFLLLLRGQSRKSKVHHRRREAGSVFFLRPQKPQRLHYGKEKYTVEGNLHLGTVLGTSCN